MYRMTFGHVFALFDVMAKYVALTTPKFDSPGAPSKPEMPDLDAVDRPDPHTSVTARVAQGRLGDAFGSGIAVKRKSELPKDTQAMLDDLERDR